MVAELRAPERQSGGLRSDTAMDRNASRRSSIAEDLAQLIALRRAVHECQIAINQSLAVIEATVEAIKLLDRLRNSRPPAADHDPHESEPTRPASPSNGFPGDRDLSPQK
jgi:hypothetical protein